MKRTFYDYFHLHSFILWIALHDFTVQSTVILIYINTQFIYYMNQAILAPFDSTLLWLAAHH